MTTKMTDFTGWTVCYGFLDGNLPDGGDAKLYATYIEEALAARFPGADIEVPHQNASGSKPMNYRPAIYRNSDGQEYDSRADEILGAIVEDIEVPYLPEGGDH